jgi:predicted branched-subunit amino acid permease
MNGAVFASPAQLLVLDMLNGPTSLAAIALATLVVNARFAILSAGVYPWFRTLPSPGRYLAVANLSAAVFGAVMALYRKGERDTGAAIGAGAAMWVMSSFGVAIGVVLSGRISDPATYGVDCIATAFFAVLAGMFFNGRATILPWLGAIAATLAAMTYLPPGIHIFAGAFAGGLIGALQNDA